MLTLSPRNKLSVAYTLIALWLASTVFAFWWFQFRHQFAFNENTQVLEIPDDFKEKLHLSSEEQHALVVHFFDKDCLCSRFNQAHVQEIINNYSTLGVDFRIAVPDASQIKIAEETFGQPAFVANNLEFAGSPLALVFNQQIEPAYLGAYSESIYCSSTPGQNVETVLDQLIKQGRLSTQLSSSRGCFCPWEAGQKT
ncbi:hypothetical protein SAMN05660443_0181 [Marinospirillum celere]|uniref:DUF6436 domain-containing protein n=1 Tax=Marinospirillum celere TaxID=1122252 RepID=A0A1I1E3T5_9GAMM|nr:DUF6436 domain-containing protein [Marinospirillum celere]SFB79590.1 hypothetical protein SAMN05660443_0181 [Marinospirillum celere]